MDKKSRLFTTVRRNAQIISLGLATGCMASGYALAEGASRLLMDEVVVTAQKRAQNINDVGISITARTGEQMRSMGIVDSKDIAKIAPGVVFDSTASGGAAVNLTIRGVSQSDFSPTQESPNSIYIDDVYIASSNAAAFTFYDLDRVEVLRGPQGTLFGRASSGGLAHFISKKPSDEFEAYFEAGYGRFNSYHLEGAIGGAVSDGVRVRLSGRTERADGWWKNVAQDGIDTFEKKFFGVRGQVEVDLTEELVANLTISFDKKPRHREGTYKQEVFALDGNGLPTPVAADFDAYGAGAGNDFTGYRDTLPDGQAGNFDNIGFLETERFAPTLNLQWQGENVSITSITNYTKFKFSYLEDCDGGPTDYCNFPISQNLDQFSQELRANGQSGAVIWTAGLYYMNIDQKAGINFEFPSLSGTDFAFSDFNAVSQKVESYAAFGQLEIELTEQLSATGGIRYTRDTKTIDSKVFFRELGNGYSGGVGTTIFTPPLSVYDYSTATVGDQAKSVEGMWSGKLQLDYTPDEDTLIFMSASRGVKAPGFNTNVSGNLTNAETPFRSEIVYAYELGSKLSLLDKTLQLNTSAFYYDYSRFQGFAFNGLQGVVGNYDGYFYGAEMEVLAYPTEGLLISFGASYLKSKLRDIPTTYSGLQDQESILAPRWTLNGLVNQSFEVGSGQMAVQWSFDFVDDRYASIENTPATFLKGSFVHNVRVSYTLEDEGLEFAAFVNNVSDVDRENFVFDLIATGGYLLKSYSKPRWWGVSIRKNF